MSRPLPSGDSFVQRPSTLLCVALLVATVGLAACGAPEPTTPGTPESDSPLRAGLVVSGPGDSVFTPAGWRSIECVSAVPNRAFIHADGRVDAPSGAQMRIATCPSTGRGSSGAAQGRTAQEAFAPTVSGWLESVQYTGAEAFSSLEAGWRIPAAPTSTGVYSSGAVYYSFPGLMNGTYILQPVIQYGAWTGAGPYGGNYWTMVPWRCNSGSDCTHGTAVSVSPGDSVTGSVTSASCSGGTCTWTVALTNVTTSASTSMSFSDSNNYSYSTGGAVEVYGLTGCSNFPAAGIYYSGIKLRNQSAAVVTPYWTPFSQTSPSPSCGYAVSHSASTARLYHNYSALSAYVTLNTGTSVFTAHPSGGASPPYTYSWEWCAVNCDGGDAFTATTGRRGGRGVGGGPGQEAVEQGWHTIASTSQSVCFDLLDSLLRLTVRDIWNTPYTVTTEVGSLYVSCS